MKYANVMKQIFLGLTVSLMLPAGTAFANTVTIDFDDAPLGFQTSTYSSSPGVTFSGGLGGNGINVQAYALSNIIYPGLPSNFYNPGNLAVFLNAAGCCSDTPTVTATFAQDVSNVSMIFLDTELGTYLGRMQAFDVNNVLLADTGMVITPNSTYPGFQVLSLNVGGIRSIQFYTDNDGAVVDNLTFTTAVPEPASIALVGLGLAGLGFSRRRKQKLAA